MGLRRLFANERVGDRILKEDQGRSLYAQKLTLNTANSILNCKNPEKLGCHISSFISKLRSQIFRYRVRLDRIRRCGRCTRFPGKFGDHAAENGRRTSRNIASSSKACRYEKRSSENGLYSAGYPRRPEHGRNYYGFNRSRGHLRAVFVLHLLMCQWIIPTCEMTIATGFILTSITGRSITGLLSSYWNC